MDELPLASGVNPVESRMLSRSGQRWRSENDCQIPGPFRYCSAGNGLV